MKCSHFRFTLVEMLVVVMILVMLVAILLPSLQQALDVARQTSCANNQRNCSVAVQTYASDFHGVFIANGVLYASGYPASRDVAYWSKILSGKTIGGYDAEFTAYNDNDKIYVCPSIDESDSSDHNTYGVYSDWGTTQTPSVPNNSPLTPFRKIVRIPSPSGSTNKGVDLYYLDRAKHASDLPLFSDTITQRKNHQRYMFYHTINFSHSSSGGLHLRHKNRSNTLFWDGHIEACDIQKWDQIGEVLHGLNSTSYSWTNRFDMYVGMEFEESVASTR